MGRTVAELHEEEPRNPMVLVIKGWYQYFSARDKEDALATYNLALEAIELGPDLADAYMLASFIELNNPYKIVSSDQAQANQLAEERARKAAELDTTSPHNYGAIGNTLSGVGKVKESLDFYKKALEITPHAEAWIKYNYMNALVSIGQYNEGKQIAMEISKTDQFVNDARARAMAILAYIAHKEGEKKNAAAFMESLNNIALNTEQSGSKLETIMWGFWNVKSNEKFIEDFKATMMQLGI
jgi:tetratricopeptide (TPR) repeat protein